MLLVSRPYIALLGQAALHEQLQLAVPPPAVRSAIISGARSTSEVSVDRIEEFYPPQYRRDGSPLEHLRFALRYEPLDLRVMHAALKTLGGEIVRAAVQREPTGSRSRRLWFLHERLTGDTLDLPSAVGGNYVDALDTRLHHVSSPAFSARQRVRDNLLGGPGLCATVRRTQRLDAWISSGLAARAAAVMAEYSADTLGRAASYLYTKETRSSFAIEGETPDSTRETRFLALLRDAARFQPGEAELVRLQNRIVDPRYAERGWRQVQNFIGETTRSYGQYVRYVCPRPSDVPGLMQGWERMTERLVTGGLDPVLAAAACAFAFVFVHPFEDGNGRIHRFLIHHVLTRTGFCPPGAVFPVSASILRSRGSYDAALDGFSGPIMQHVGWRMTDSGEVAVTGETLDLYRFFDATALAEYLYDRINDSLRTDFQEELEFIVVYDAALLAIKRIVDMPDRKASLMAQVCLRNGGRMSIRKRELFAEITDDELSAIEAGIQAAMAARGDKGQLHLPL